MYGACCQLLSFSAAVACPPSSPLKPHILILNLVHCRHLLNHVDALQTANIPAADLLYVNYNNLVEGLLPYSVALDAARRCVVVAIRGSLSVEDCVTGRLLPV